MQVSVVLGGYYLAQSVLIDFQILFLLNINFLPGFLVIAILVIQNDPPGGARGRESRNCIGPVSSNSSRREAEAENDGH